MHKTSDNAQSKSLWGATFDPHNETLFAAIQPSQGPQSGILRSVPVGALEEEGTYSVTLAQQRSEEHSTQKMRSLTSMKSDGEALEREAIPQGQSPYLQPYYVGKSKAGEQVYLTDTYKEPDCLRLCPSNSSDQVEISLSGLTALSKAQGQYARANKEFNQGVHYWEIICPISCQTLQIGVSNKNNKEEVVQQFRTSTPRVIGIELNLEKFTLNFWLNGRPIKERAKKIPPDQHWYPLIKFKEPDYYVILNPYAQGKGNTTDDMNDNYLPLSLRTGTLSLYSSYLGGRLKGFQAIYGLSIKTKGNKEEDDKELKKTIRLETHENVKVHYILNEQETITCTLIQFESYQESLKYYWDNKDLRRLYDQQIASFILQKNKQSQALESELGVSLTRLLKDANPLGLSDIELEEFSLHSGLSTNFTVDQLAKNLTNLKDKLESDDSNIKQEALSQSDRIDIGLQYLENSDKLLVVNGSQMKLITREKGQFELEGNFRQHPQKPEDIVKLKVQKDDFKFMMYHLDWRQLPNIQLDTIYRFLQSARQSSSHYINVPYIIGLQSIKGLLNIAINQYEVLEENLESLQQNEILPTDKPVQISKNEGIFDSGISLPWELDNGSILDINRLLSILLDLEDQLWSMVQTDQANSNIKDLWSLNRSTSRIHTAFGRLGSLITLPSSSNLNYDPAYLAELGLINTQDQMPKLQHFQQFKVELESVFEKSQADAFDSNHDSSDNSIRHSLERQFPNNLMLKGFPTWNVPLSKTLNNMPPQVHENGLKQDKKSPHSVDYLKTIDGSNFLLSAGSDGSVNIWSTKVSLQQVFTHNFKSKLHHEEDIIKNAVAQKEGTDAKFIIKSGNVKKNADAKEEKQAEDILFSMFDEEEAAEDVADAEVQSNKAQDDYTWEFIADFTDPTDTSPKDQKAKQKEQKKQQDQEEEKKAEEPGAKQEEEKVVEPNQDFLNQLVLMGFSLELSKKALIQTKNESLSAAIDAIMEIQTKEPKTEKKEPIIEMKIISYECEVCTLINGENKSICEACGTPAPQKAYIQVKSEEQSQKEKEDQDQKKREEEENRQKEAEEERLKQEAEEKKRQEESEQQRQRERLILETREYYQSMEIRDFLFAQVNGGADAQPLIAGVLLQKQGKQDIELIRLGYDQSYLKMFIHASKGIYSVSGIPFKSFDEALKHLLVNHRPMIESCYPMYIGNLMSKSKWHLKTGRHNQSIMRPEPLAVLNYDFESIDAFCQIGSNLTKDRSMYIMIVGKKPGQQNQTTIIERIEFSPETSDLKITTVSEQSQVLMQAGVQGKVVDIKYCQKSDILVISSEIREVLLYKIDRAENQFHLHKHHQILLSPGESLAKVENGNLIVNVENRKIKVIVIDDEVKRFLRLRKNLKSHHLPSSFKEAVSQQDVIQMQIDESQVTVQDIRRYEKLMNGKPIKAISNAHQPSIETRSGREARYFTKHHWLIDSPDYLSSPLEMEFEHPTSLISLNVELTFDCIDLKGLVGGLSKEAQPREEEEKQVLVQESATDTALNLGLLTIHGQNHESHMQVAMGDSSDSKKVQTYLPLVVHHHKGSSYNQSYQSCKMVVDNNMIFASNYPRPEFYFKHMHGHKMNIEKFTVRSPLASKSGAYPVGFGLVFISDQLEAFEHTLPFHRFNSQDYNEWRQKRLKDPSPLKPWEPVAFFEMESDPSITVDIDFQRSCRYIMLKPTGFRKKPTHFTQNINNVPMEIEFFGVTGTSFEDCSLSQSTENENIVQDMDLLNTLTNYEMEIRILNDTQIIKTIPNIQVSQLFALDIPISSKVLTCCGNEKLRVSARTFLKVTDSHLQLQDIRGVAITFKRTTESLWHLKDVAIQGIVAEQEKQSLAHQKPLFNQTHIPLSYMRSCLLSPKYFNVVNKVLSHIVYSSKHQPQLRLTTIQLLNKIMRLDKDFVPLIQYELDLAQFLKTNLFTNENASTQLIVEFLQNFQRDPQFCQDIYEILLKLVKSLPDNFILYNGYEALIGMLQWAMPIDPERTLSVLICTLYNKVCLDKVTQLQTKEYITFRSRFGLNEFPFDRVAFKPPRHNQGSDQRKESIDATFINQISSIEQFSKTVLPIEQMKKIKRHENFHIFEVKFDQEMLVQDIKLYLGQIDQVHYKMIIRIFSECNDLVFLESYEEHVFAHFAQLAYAKPSLNGQDDALHITGLNFKTKEFKFILEFSTSQSTLPRSGTKHKPPDSLIEVYGQMQQQDMGLSQKLIKDKIDKKAQQFWQEGAKIFKIGNSMQMLQIIQNVEESLLVPQVSQVSSYVPPPLPQEQNPAQPEQKPQVQISHLAASRQSELELLQEELMGKIRANDPNVREIVDKISVLQAEMTSISDQDKDHHFVPSLEYYLTIACDFTKIIRQLSKSPKLSNDKLKKLLRDADKYGNLSQICFDLFKRFIVYDSGCVRKDILAFISQTLYPIMSSSDITAFSFRVIEEFLSSAQVNFSQKAVLDSLNTIGIQEGELVSFLIHKLGIGYVKDTKTAQLSDQTQPLQPFVFMSSVLILALNQLKKGQSTSEKKKEEINQEPVKLIIYEKKPQQQEVIEDDDFVDLAPLNMSRSLSQPTSLVKSNSTKNQSTKVYSYQKVGYDMQFVILFHTCVWIAQDQQKQFTSEEKVVLLNLAFENMLFLIKHTDAKHILDVIRNKDAFFHIIIAILQLKSRQLISLFKSLFDAILKAHQEAKDSSRKLLLEIIIQHIQSFLKWLIDIGIKQDASKPTQQGQEEWNMLLQCYSNQRVWMDHLSFMVELFIKATDEVKEVDKPAQSKEDGLEKIPEAQNENDTDNEDLPPLSMVRSISMPLKNGTASLSQEANHKTQDASLQIIKNLVQLLHLNEPSQSQSSPCKRNPFCFTETESQIKYLSHMWSLVLKSLTAVPVNSLIDAKIFDSLVNAFIISTEEIKQITFPQILQITETIASQSVHTGDISKFISNLLFITLDNVTDNHHEKVGYSICQGWLDILIASSVSRPQNYESSKQVYGKMGTEDIATFMKKTANYLNAHLNKGSFEGITGANPQIMMRLNLASDLIYVIRHTEFKGKPGTLALQELFRQVGTNQKLKKDYQESFSHLLVWLFLNARQAQDEVVLSQLGNSSSLTPATAKVKQMTEHIEEIFNMLGECGEECEEAVKIALQSLTSVVRKMNQTLLELASQNSLGFEMSVKMSDRANEYFIKLLRLLLINDSIASYFVFDLRGFEFLLDTIGVGSESEGNIKRFGESSMEFEIVESNENGGVMQQIVQQDLKTAAQNTAFESSNLFSVLQGSDLIGYLEQNLQEFQTSQTQTNIDKVNTEQVAQTAHYDKSTPQYVQEFSKSIAMISNNGGDPPANYQKTDWSVNKRSYKHRIIVKHLTEKLKSEYWILFQLSHEVEIREIQIAFNNYWSIDTEIYAEPLSVLVEAGLEENNLSLVCNLQIVKDDAFGSVSATVFGQNLQTFPAANQEVFSSSIEDIIQQKLQSIQNFKVKYIKFCMRRHILTCLENSPLSTKFTKQPAFGINYISLLGYDLTKIGEFLSYIKQEQKKTALEVLSIICSGDFANILKVIANQEQTIEKMKKSFNLLASLVSIKQNLIEPTFIAISTYNTSMGDWIINQFLKTGKNQKHASLIGQIIMCNISELPRRILLLKDHVITQLREIEKEQRATHGTLIKKLLPFVQIFIQTLRIAAQDLDQQENKELIDLGVKESYLLDIVHLLSSATQERQMQTKTLTQLLVLLLCPPAPFTNTMVDVFEFTVKHLLEEQTSDDAQVMNIVSLKENLASILAAQRSEIAQEIFKRGLKLNTLLNPGNPSNAEDQRQANTQLQHYLKFWINVSQDEKVRNHLADNKIPQKLYEILRQESPDQNNKIIRKDAVIGPTELQLYIELIKAVAAGSKVLETELAKALMDDLAHLSRIRDMDFVNKVFLQLLRIEKTVPVCLWPYDIESKKWIPTFRPMAQADSQSGATTVSSATFVPSTILQGEKKQVFIKNFKDIMTHHNKAGLKKVVGGNWNLAHSQTEQGQVSQFQNFWKNIENKAPLVFLIQGTTTDGKNVVYGCYSSKGVPAMPANLAQDSDYQLKASPEDFVFCYIEETSFHHFQPKQGVSLLSMFTDYEGGGAISIANDFMLMSYSYDFVFTVGILYDLEKIQVESNPKPEQEVASGGALTLQKFEVWCCDTSKSHSAPPTPSQPSQVLPKSVKAGEQFDSQIEGSFSHEVKHSWYNALSPYVNYRTNPVFMVPAHLTLSQLSKILLQSTVQFKAEHINLAQNSDTLEELYEQLQTDTKLYLKHNGILDFEYVINQIIPSSSSAEESKDEEHSGDQESTSQILSGYVPKMGLFEQFENQGGVKAIISVTQKSMKLWKSTDQAKSWEMWLNELESFSEIPLFFQLFLKNTRCKDLLFKVLAGLPDQELTANGKPDTSVAQKWTEEQKIAVQFNYKILSEAFKISDDLKLRETAMKSGLLPRILERLSAISGEKPRVYEETEQEKEEQKKGEEQASSQQMIQQEKNVEKKKRKGVGYSSKVGQTFNVTQYLENKKIRNEQIKNLIDICSNFLNCKDWKADQEVLDIIFESALLPILEAAFRNGSWLDMTKDYEVYHSYLSLTRAIAGQKNLIKSLVEIDKHFKPMQTDPIYKLLAKLNDLAEIFINCLNQQQQKEQLKKQQPSEIKTQPPIIKTSNQNVIQPVPNPLINAISNLPGTLQSFIHAYYPQEEKATQDQVLNLLGTSFKHQLSSDDEEEKKEHTLKDMKAKFHSAHSSSDDDICGSLEKINDTNEEIKEGKILNKVLEHLKPEDKLKEQSMNVEKVMTDYFAKNINAIFDQTEQPQPTHGMIQQQPLMNKNNESDDEEYETISEHSVDSQGNTIKSGEDSQKESDYETVEEESYGEQSESKLKKKKQLAANKTVKGSNKVKQSPHFKKIKMGKTGVKHKKYKSMESSDSEQENQSGSEDSDEDQSEYESENASSSSSSQSYDHEEGSDGNSEDAEEMSQENSDEGGSSQEYDTESEHTVNDNDQDDRQEHTLMYALFKEFFLLPLVRSGSRIVFWLELIFFSVSTSFLIHKLTLNLFCRDSEIPENLARDVIKTYNIVQAAVAKLLEDREDDFIENALNLPLAQSYRALLQDSRFDKMDMLDPNDKAGVNYKHHYSSLAPQNQNPPPGKMVRLAQELADLSNALPCEHTNAIFVRVDERRVDMMKALICGASGTPYAHGCFEYDIFCDNNYPRDPPKVNLITTGNGGVRFNPNLYACGKVCLSLLGTWRGSATENWDPKLSTILQVLLSTQAIIMSEEVYFNEPGFENEAGTPEGEKKNEGYQNIVRYCNIKFAMLEQIKRPSKGFESVIKRHFFVKKPEILQEVHHWLELAEKNEATYSGLVNDHNYNWANQFKASKTKYKEMLEQVVKQLEDELNKLERPTDYELKYHDELKKKKGQQAKKKKRQAITEGKAELGEIDVETDEENEMTQINTQINKEINVEDEAVKDRWSRYIGAMGVEAVAKQASASIFLSGAGALGIEIAKNIVLSGCKAFTLHDYKPITMKDLSGQFFLNLEEDVLNEKKKKNTRGEACMPRLKQLNYYVKCLLAPPVPLPLDESVLEQQPWNFHKQDVIVLTEATYEEIIFINEYCRKRGKKFIAADAYGVFTRVFNDFGTFEVLDQNGEELQDVMIKSISNEAEGLVELLPNTKHKFQDGDEVLFTQVEGMNLLEGQSHDDEAFKNCTSINGTIHKVKVVTPYAFRVGDTLKYSKYVRNGIAKQLKVKKQLVFKSFKDSMLKGQSEIPLDANLSIADFEKMQNNQLAHIAFEALDLFRKANKCLPGPWNLKDAIEFIENAKAIAKRYDINTEEWKPDGMEIMSYKFFYLFAFTCQGVFNPLCAFQGGFVAQEIVKAITQKFTPTNQVFYYDSFEVLPDFDPQEHLQQDFFQEKYVKEIVKAKEIGHRSDGLRIVLGGDMIDKLAYTRLFMVGAGAIGCELLKNYAMLGVGVGKANQAKKIQGGSIVLTDPDVIEVSNLNRQFLFREKHLRKPKSSTAAAAAINMNKELKDNIIARLDKVHEGTNHIFTDQFFEGLSVVTNALDNVHARRYIDARCVIAKTPLLESGTLGPKGHVQVVLPYQTESYGSQNDPEDNTEIPHCTLKMFPEETLHCVEWARDKFGKLFTQGPQNTIKILEEGESFQPSSQQDAMSLKEGLKIIEKRPKGFDECVEYARIKFEKFFNHDIRQLLHVYPLDAKTKDGNLFWSLPKRPPVPIEFNPKNPLHCLFVTSMACLRANVFKIEIPSKSPRSEEFKQEIGVLASKLKVPEFVPNDEKAKEIQASVQKEVKEEEKKEGEEQEEKKLDDMESLMNKFHQLLSALPKENNKIQTDQLLAPELFEKDNDANFHIDFIYSMANCRSTNYKLELMDWINVKLKAGRIIPALSTTTSCVAGLQTLELVKLLKVCKKVDHRNIFLNLAVPIMQASEPGDVIKTKLVEGIEVTLWDRWEIKKGKVMTLKGLITHFEQSYLGLEVRDVLKGTTIVYFHTLMNAPGKEEEKHKVLESKIIELAGADSDDKYVDLNVTCIVSGDKSEKILSGVPPVRVYFE